MKKLVVGILAHVDAGKTTLSEAVLYVSGSIRKLGRVDNRDAFLDTYELERSRGITIFSKQAQLALGDTKVTLLDTPGHVDFSAEMERTLQVLDYAILVISGADGVQGHTMTLWRLLARYQIPVFLFINKMDQEGTDREKLLGDLKQRLHEGCVDFDPQGDRDVFWENLAVCDEAVLERYLEEGEVSEEDVIGLIRERKAFPCYFGSALKLDGIQEFLDGVCRYTQTPSYPEEFGAKVFKIARDDQGNRLTYMKITGGTLKVKMPLSNRKMEEEQTEDIWEEKADQIRIYSGAKYDTVTEAPAGSICAVTGLSRTYPGEGLGIDCQSDLPILEPVLTYEIQLPPGCDAHVMLQKLKELEEEEPQLHIVWNEALGEIHAQVMGEVQIEILKSLIARRFGVAVEFGAGNIVYKETIAASVEGVGHFEPLRHYAEVHLLLEPGERGSGMQYYTACSEDVLDRNWQRLILTHLEEREHIGVLTGSPITDVRITLLAGRAHLKHTEGGDFRQATYRAVRQGLKKARSILLEPYYEYRLEVPAENVGRALSDIQKMHGTFGQPQMEGETAVLTGTAPVAQMRDYQMEVVSYTRGMGRLFCSLKGYEPCADQEAVVAYVGYDSERDLENPTGSVFCDHGAGFVVSWDKVEEYMHLDPQVDLEPEEFLEEKQNPSGGKSFVQESKERWSSEKELEEIFARTYGPVKRFQEPPARKVTAASADARPYRPQKKAEPKEYLLVDGYNIIFAWEELKELAQVNIDGARTKLMDILCNYQGYKKCTLILVFDAYKLENYPGEVVKYHNIYVVYTKEAETADQYIEKAVHEIGRKYHVTVATSDGLEQVIILGQGGHLLSAKEFKEEIRLVQEQIREEAGGNHSPRGNYLFDNLSPDLADYMEEIRLGKKESDKNHSALGDRKKSVDI
ncbi:MAG: NYN domain-containing protein [Blautia sp.]|jgi:ribosomal protection tetracycline resistance protein